MKAWFVWVGEEWGDYVHGENANKAKTMFWREWGIETEWIWLQPRRVTRLDDKPITNKSILEGYEGWEAEEYKDWRPICKCQLCI